MIFKLLEVVEGRWRRINGLRQVVVRAGVKLANGKLVEGSEEKDAG